ncbi:MAG: hypothetical protein HC821_01130 [Lewinella sp.]|nr:hypothetical protein [Lewinella sp.]
MMIYDLRIFEFHYLRWAGKSVRKHQQTVLLVQSSQLALPQLWMQPETIIHKIGELLGFNDIDFSGHPKFSGQYHLSGQDEDFIRHHFSDDLLYFFKNERGWSMEGLGYYLLLYRKDVLLNPSQTEKLYHQGLEVFRLLAKQNGH